MTTATSPDRPAYGNVAVLRMLRGLGDMLCTVPALRALRAALPEAHIALIGLPSARPFVTRFSNYIDELIECPGYPGVPEKEPAVAEVPRFLISMQARWFDLAIQMHGNGTVTNPLLALLGARANAGFFVPGQFCPDSETFLPYVESRSEIVRYVELVESLGIPSTDFTLEFPLWKDDREALAEVAQAGDLWPGEYVCVHPGAHDPLRCWPAERFALVADFLEALGMPVIITGSRGERELTGKVARAMKRPAVDLAGQTTLGALAVLLSNARLLVCNDTGISHIAAALHVPSVIVFTNSDPARWAPLDRRLHRPVIGPSPGRPAVRDLSDGGDRARRLQSALPSVEEVEAAAESLLLKEKFHWHEG